MAWLTHPDTGAVIEVSDGAVGHHYRAGWLDTDPPEPPPAKKAPTKAPAKKAAAKKATPTPADKEQD